jgi:uncharacterized phage infection (PIP) family protein YhgE
VHTSLKLSIHAAGRLKAHQLVTKLTSDADLSRNSSRSRPTSRLQDRLAKVVNKSVDSPRASLDLSSRPDSPALRSPVTATDTGRTSTDSKVSEAALGPLTDASVAHNEAVDKEETAAEPAPRPSTESTSASPPAQPMVSEQPTSMAVPTMSLPSILTPRTSSTRQSLDSVRSRPSTDTSTPDLDLTVDRDPAALEAELSTLQQTHEEVQREHREELNSHLERIDALQSKLTYLSQQLASLAKGTASNSEAPSADKKLAEKDAQIAALMEEGQKLSKTEMKHLTTVKKLRTKVQETDKEISTLKQRLARAEKSIGDQTERAKRAEAAERAAQEKLKIVGKIEKDIEMIRAEREEAGLTIAELRRQLNDAMSRAEDAEKRVQAGALEAEKRVTASLKDDIDNLRIEKKLAEDRGKRDVQEAKDEAARQKERAKVAELELRGEIAVHIHQNVYSTTFS